MKIIVSSCLLGENVKYSGGNNFNQELVNFLEENNFEIIKICPEIFGGLSIPRIPSEKKGKKIINKIGKDITKEFELGAEEVLEIITKNNVNLAILKENSPSCGVNNIYDGTFSNIIIKGMGLTTEKLSTKNIKIFSEKDLEKFKEYISNKKIKREVRK